MLGEHSPPTRVQLRQRRLAVETIAALRQPPDGAIIEYRFFTLEVLLVVLLRRFPIVAVDGDHFFHVSRFFTPVVMFSAHEDSLHPQCFFCPLKRDTRTRLRGLSSAKPSPGLRRSPLISLDDPSKSTRPISILLRLSVPRALLCLFFLPLFARAYSVSFAYFLCGTS